MKEPNYDEILKKKVSHYGETKAAYQYAAEEYARQYFELNKSGVIHNVIDCNHDFQRVERGGEFQGNQCECGEWEDLT